MNKTEINLIKQIIKLLEENNNYVDKTYEALELLECFDIEEVKE